MSCRSGIASVSLVMVGALSFSLTVVALLAVNNFFAPEETANPGVARTQPTESTRDSSPVVVESDRSTGTSNDVHDTVDEPRFDERGSDSNPVKSVAARYRGDLFDEDNLPSTDVPDFQKHVVPLLGRLGCNGRACHGSFQGQGGFQLSLFGFDFESDHNALLDGRVDPDDPESSRALTKAIDPDAHGGGMRFDEGGWEYNLLYRWIEGGGETEGDEKGLLRLEVQPAEIVITDPEQTFDLSVHAVWEDGTREDVTVLCRFQSNNESVAAINAEGRVESGSPGDTHVIVFYDNAVQPVSIIHPVAPTDQPANRVTNFHTRLDRIVIEKLNKLGMQQAPLCDDETFLRRISLDMTGTLPTAEEVREFLRDNDPQKRTRKIDQLLETPGYSALWTTFLCDLTGNNSRELNNVSVDRRTASRFWYDWIYKRIENNTPYNEIVEGIVLSTSREGDESYTEYCEELCQLYREAKSTSPGESRYADRATMPLYWMRPGFKEGSTRAISFAHAFMGIRIQCAQCHKHPFDQWTQQDFNQFSRFFTGVSLSNLANKNYEARDEVSALLESAGVEPSKNFGQIRRQLKGLFNAGNTVPQLELLVHQPRLPRKERNRRKRQKFYSDAILLGSDGVDLTSFEDVRNPVMKWLNRKDNPSFAKAIVNRVWAHYFGTGIVEPADDLNLANPPSNGPLLEYLADGFVDNGYDLKWLHREITLSRTYQMGWEPNDTNRTDRRNFARALPRRMPAEVVVDAMVMASTNNENAAGFAADLQSRAIGIAGTDYQRLKGSSAPINPDFALKLFGRSTRTTSCDCDRSNVATLSQTVWMLNDRDVHELLNGSNSWVAEVRGEYEDSNISEKEQRKLVDLRSRKAAMKKRQLQHAANGRKKQSENLRAKIFQITEQIDELEQRHKRQIDPDAPKLDAEQIITEAYLRTLSRYPTREETDRCLSYFRSDEDVAADLAGLMWVLINTREFIVNH